MTLASSLRENKAVYAVAGAGDLAVEKLREVPEQVTRYQGKAREAASRYQGEVRETVERYRGEVRRTVDRYREEVDAKDLPGAAVAYVTHVGTRTVEFIDELTERGKRVVHREAAEAAAIAEADAAPAPKARVAQPRRPAPQARSAKKSDA
ncbi:hypothetical protein F8568_036420 [Actinomadura sp. LD22]|uniref:Uncharacterized protein n=1 Tax=Actinomadura physcomitrii TaxID=2650748 RepID=A0A6I4MLD7_9ACTN|nr:hypothetical protein [Actinomadura physcomitrii]MWA05750.1 hypothetical protein [Actinomadura physcomitrii]